MIDDLFYASLRNILKMNLNYATMNELLSNA
jgi:hypothetical protein